jgi:hypothetical protein
VKFNKNKHWKNLDLQFGSTITQSFHYLHISSPGFIFPDTGLITYVQALTVQIEFDLRSGMRCGDATALCYDQ